MNQVYLVERHPSSVLQIPFGQRVKF